MITTPIGEQQCSANGMKQIDFQRVQPNDLETFRLIADWYLSEWKIPANKTIERLQTITADTSQFQLLMTIDGVPVSTGGLYNHVGLLDKLPRLSMYKNWLALLYTIPAERQKGYGALLCSNMEEHAKNAGLDTIYLFTDTAEQLYKRLGWIELERPAIGDRTVVVMKKEYQ